MHGQTSIAFQASAGGHARHAGTTRQTPAPSDGHPLPPGNPVRIPPLSDPHGNNLTGRWPLASFLELGALPSAVPCARLHTRQLLWEWQLTALADTAELLVSELTTNAIQASRADRRTAPVRLWLLADRASLLILVWDASPLPPVRMNTSGDAENGRGLLLVETLSTRWGFFAHHQGGKVVWVTIQALLTTPGTVPAGQHPTRHGKRDRQPASASHLSDRCQPPRTSPARHPGGTLPAHFPYTRDRAVMHLHARHRRDQRDRARSQPLSFRSDIIGSLAVCRECLPRLHPRTGVS